MVDIHPYLIQGDNAEGNALTPLPVRDKVFQEEWLQELLYKHPAILPIGYLDDSFMPLIPIGREIAAIDNLFISPSGCLTIVETKLWRNPEAHRTVVAQILEYAKTLSTWTYETLDKAVSSFLAKRHGASTTIYQAVKSKVRNFDLSEVEFHAKVQDCLTRGKFALVVVGDKIFPEATQLAEIIQSAPHLDFTMGFVELRCFRLEKGADWPLVVVPNFITKTNEVTRAVVRVIYEEKKPEVKVDTVTEGTTTTSAKTSFPLFIASLPSNLQDLFKGHIEHWIKSGYTLYWGSSGFSLRLPINGKLETIMDAYPTYIGILTEKARGRIKLPEDLYRPYKENLMASPYFSGQIAAGRTYVYYDSMDEADVVHLLNAVDDLATEISK